jgi:predicted phage terminase large subunit-like protein
MDIKKYKNLDKEQLKAMVLLRQKIEQEGARTNFMRFVKAVWPEFVEGPHHLRTSEKFQKFSTEKACRLIINMPPRHTKSEFASYLFPAWMMGINPKLKIIQATHTGELAVRFGRKIRNLMNTKEYKRIFPGVTLRTDNQAAGRWETNHGGEYFAAGVGGAITGRGADLLIIDDPHSEQDALSETAMDNAYEWYTSGPRQRLQPGGSIAIVMTRWSQKDLTAQLVKKMGDLKADKWDVIEFPAILDDDDEENRKPIWPQYWKLDELDKVKASLVPSKWNAQWQQNPTYDGTSIIKREWWRVWDKPNIPDCYFRIQTYDTAFSKKETADYSVISTWGIFYPNEGREPHIILLDVEKGRWDFPELKKKAMENLRYHDPELVIIEAKATGMPLIHELRRAGIHATAFSPNRGQDKHVRVNTVAPIFEAGHVWRSDDDWAIEMMEECAAFPFGEHDDMVDAMTLALLRYRQGNLVELEDDEDINLEPRSKRKYVYYNG